MRNDHRLNMYIHKKASIFIINNQYIILPSSYHIIQSIYNSDEHYPRKFIIPLGSPDPRLLLTGFLQLVLAQSEGSYKRQISLDGSLNKLYHNRVFPTDSTAFYNLSALYLSKSENPPKNKQIWAA